LKFYLSYFILVFLVTGCGYKATSNYAKNEITGKIFVISSIDIENSQNSIIIKDTINEMILNKFNATLTSNKSIADTIIVIKLSGISHQALSTDNEGYTDLYRTSVDISVKYKNNNIDTSYKSLSLSNYYDYTVNSDSLVTEQKKLEAIRLASSTALSDIFSKIAVNSFRKKNIVKYAK
jgi:hypothetical protein